MGTVLLVAAVAVALLAVIIVAIAPSIKTVTPHEPTKTQCTYWRVGDKIVERGREPGGDTFFSVDGRIALKWDNVEPSKEEVMAILRERGVEADAPWT